MVSESEKLDGDLVLRVNDHPFDIHVSEESWRADLEWWMYGNKQNEEGDDNSISTFSSSAAKTESYLSGDRNIDGWSSSFEEVEETFVNNITSSP
ncbi:hypothetical protein SLE2022_036640 [Rubroshorea leprosula]